MCRRANVSSGAKGFPDAVFRGVEEVVSGKGGVRKVAAMGAVRASSIVHAKISRRQIKRERPNSGWPGLFCCPGRRRRQEAPVGVPVPLSQKDRRTFSGAERKEFQAKLAWEKSRQWARSGLRALFMLKSVRYKSSGDCRKSFKEPRPLQFARQYKHQSILRSHQCIRAASCVLA